MRIEHGHQTAEVSPQGRLTSWQVGGSELIAGHGTASGNDGSRSALLAPWPNRLYLGRWSWRGRDLQLPINKGDSAIHGLVTTSEFEVTASTPSSISLTHDLAPTAGYPFALQITARYALGDGGLTCALEALNTGTEDAPVGLGVHPYLATPGLVDDLSLSVPPVTRVSLDETWNEVSRTPWSHDGPLREAVLDTAFTDLPADFETVVSRPDGISVALWTTGRWLLIFTADTLSPAEKRRSLAIEPMTCPPNALATGDLDVLAPGQLLILHWGLSPR
jgi:galactose mutarotase-like enzyme